MHFDIGNNSNFVNAELFPSPLILFCFVSFVLVLFFAVDSLPAVLQCFCCIGLLAAVVFLLYVEGCQRDFVSAICSLICQPKGSPSPSFPGFSFLIFFSISASSRLSHITTFGTLPRHLHFFAPGLRTSLSWPGSGNLLGEPKLLHLTLIFVQSLRDNGGDRAGSLS